MAHQPFENWIHNETALSSEQKNLLKEHLATCAKCQQLELTWLSVKQQFKAEKSISPKPGFTARWRAQFPARLVKHQNELAKRWFAGLAGVALFSIILLLVQSLATDSGDLYLTNLSYLFTQVSGFFKQLRNVILLLLNGAPGYVWAIAGIVAASWIGIIVFTGSVIILKYRNKGALTNEETH